IDDSFLHINLDCYLSAIIDYLQLYTRRASIVQPKFDLVDMQGDLQHIHQLPNTLKGKDTHLSNQDEYAIVIFNDNSGQDCSGCRISVDILTQRGFRGKYCQVLCNMIFVWPQFRPNNSPLSVLVQVLIVGKCILNSCVKQL
ncbi:MAG: hypothetical protein MHMPM18_002478, partial [Marteilia pararefringens]